MTLVSGNEKYANVSNYQFSIFPMSNKTDYDLSKLIYRRISGEELSDEEDAYLQQWKDADERNAETYNSLVDSAKRQRDFLDVLITTRKMKTIVEDRLKESFTSARKGPNFFWKTLPYWAAAILVIAAATVWLLKPDRQNIVNTAGKRTPALIQPGTDKAILTLADGSTLPLNAQDTGLLTKQGKAVVVQQGNGQLSYQNTLPTDAVVYNIITTPRGGQYRIVLADGSKVWLNSATKLRFPSSFEGNHSRTVELLEGEAYFDVSHNKQLPFIVKVLLPSMSHPMEVTVLGTEFNIMAYPREGTVRTTLVAGKVAITNGASRYELRPMEQAISDTRVDKMNVSAVNNIDTVVDWVHGMFEFKNDNLTTFLNKISMWYDIDVEYANATEGQASSRRKGITASIRRTTSLSEVLLALRGVGVNYEIKERTIIVFL
ncbi:FecR family protein [Pseudoflavitalea sp. X16]|uniref:FecR family protein n=1 Tax=Paraflavitalea devenefica TaxID=2716334 RepID=UPI0014223264|nr:FecR family protein [Paraflavitalea devenefica]NII26143.1 FecR family protein [Paraflavitalea devenefica]